MLKQDMLQLLAECMTVLAREEERMPVESPFHEKYGVDPIFSSLFEALHERGDYVDIETVIDKARLANESTGTLLCPSHIVRFINNILEKYKADSILDISAGIGSLIRPIYETHNLLRTVGLCSHKFTYDMCMQLHQDTSIEWLLGNPMAIFDELTDDFDVIIGIPPSDEYYEHIYIHDYEGREIDLGTSLEEAYVAKASKLLRPGGVGIYLISELSFFSTYDTFFENLERLNLCVTGAISVNWGPYRPINGSPPSLLIIVERDIQQNKLKFVGELADDADQISALSNNFLLQKVNNDIYSNPKFGIWVDAISPLDYFHAKYQYSQFHTPAGFQKRPLSELSSKIVRMTADESFSAPAEPSNAVYTPCFGWERILAVTCLADIVKDNREFIQITLNENEVLSEYVAHYLNSQRGQLGLRSLKKTMWKIHMEEMPSLPIVYPNMQEQLRIVETASHVANVKVELAHVENEFASAYELPPPFSSDLQRYSEQSLYDWFGRLPFPLSSILRLYNSENIVERKVSHLLDFFEATSQLITTILLSLIHDVTHSHREYKLVIFGDKKLLGDLHRPSFGSWNYWFHRLIKAGRELLNESSLSMGKLKSGFMDAFSNQKLYSILKQIEPKRNSWRGHGGFAGDKESKDRLIWLEGKLSDVHGIIADHFSPYVVLSPVNNVLSDGTYTSTVKVLGSTAPFEKRRIHVNSAMDSSCLYLSHTQSEETVRLLRFIRLFVNSDSEMDICYFYNRIDSNRARWISYHYSAQSELMTDGKSVEDDIRKVSLL